MTFLTPVDEWSEVYQIETNDRVLGGEGGIANTPSQQLLNRIEWLKNRQPIQAATISELRSLNGFRDGDYAIVNEYSAGSGAGGGLLFWDAESTAPDNGVTVFANAGATIGRWVRPPSQFITPYDAGAVDGVDSSDALDLFGAFVTADAGKTRIKLIGDLKISRPWPFVFQGQESFDCDLKLTATTGMRYMLALKGTQVTMPGTITVVGTGSVGVYSTMTVEYGVVLNGVQSSKLPSIRTSLHKYEGVVQDENGQIGIPITAPAYHNNTNFEFGGMLMSRDAGCSQASTWTNHTTVYDFSNPVHTGTSGTAGQRTTVDVTGIPYDANLVNTPVFAIINNVTYKVESTDFANNKLSLFPWMETTEPVSGQIRYVFGGSLFNQGSNSGPTKIGAMDAIRTGIGCHDAALYGANAFSITTQFCGFGLVLGNSGASIGPQSSAFIGVYTEQVFRNVIFLGSGSSTIINRYGAFSGEPFLNCERLAPNNRTGDRGAFADVDMWRRVYMPASTNNMLRGAYFKGKARNQDNAGSSISVSPANIVPRLYKRDSWTINLVEDALANKTKGLDDGILGFVGTGTNGAPTGTFTFNPPSGWTVNGAASAAFTGFPGAAIFMLYWEIATKNVIVRTLVQKSAAQANSTATDVAGVVADFNALLAKLRTAGLLTP